MTWRSLAIAYGIGLVPALVMAYGQPVWSPIDEPAHYDVIAQYAAGVYPHDAVTTIRPETLEVMQRTGVFGSVVDNAYAYPDVRLQKMPSGLSPDAHALWIHRHGYQFSYEAFQPPLYYATALPAWMIGKAIGGAPGSVLAVRIFDALLAALLAPLAMLIVLALWPAARAAGWAAALLTAVMPGVAINLTSISNDVLVSVLAAACVLVAISGPWTRRRLVAAGILFGAALLTATAAFAVAPALAIALLDLRRGGGRRPLVTAFGIAAVCFFPWLVANVVIYGELFPIRQQLAMAAFPPPTLDPSFWSISTLHSFVTFWTGEPFHSLPGGIALVLVAAVLTLLALAGLWRARRSADIPHQALLVLAIAAAGAALVSLTSPVLSAVSAPGRLAYVGLGAAMALVAIGLRMEVRSPRLRWATIGTFVALALAGESLLIYNTAQPPPRLRQMIIANKTALGAYASFGDLTVQALSCVIDTSHDVWLNVRFENEGTTAVEWSQHMEVHAGGESVATSDYRQSTPFPVALAARTTYTGWIYIGPNAKVGGQTGRSLFLRDLAADNYSRIGNLDIPTPLC